MAERSLLNRNLAAIPSQYVKRVVSGAPMSPPVEAVVSRSGPTVAMARVGDRAVHLNSRYHPIREAERLASDNSAADTLVLIGMDGGFLPRALLAAGVARVLVVEPDVGLLRGILSVTDMSDVLGDDRVHLAIDADALSGWLARRYMPVLHGSAAVLVPPGRRKLPSSGVPEARLRVAGVLDGIAVDYSTQAKFGRIWTRNIILGLARSVGVRQVLHGGRSAAVVAAGPSLDGEIMDVRSGRFDTVVSVDTVLPALRRRGIEPDYVVSIDPQPIGYHHYLQGVAAKTIVVTDVGSPQVRRLQRRVLFTGGHPLSRALREHGLDLPSWDTSGGSVTQTAVDFCRAIGVREVRLFGADFSYGLGAAYARGTYVFDVFRGRESRYRPLSSQATGFILNRSERKNGHYRSALLDRYAMRFFDWCRNYGVTVEDRSVLRLPSNRHPDISTYTLDHGGTLGALSALAQTLSRFSVSDLERVIDLDRLDQNRARALVTLLPLAAWWAQRGITGPEALSQARSMTLEYLRFGIRLLMESQASGARNPRPT